MHASTVESGLELLIRRKPGYIHDTVGTVGPVDAIASRAGRFSGHLPAIVAPVETEPGSKFPGLVLKMGGLVELLIVIDAKDLATGRRCADSADLRLKEPRGHAGHHHECRQTVVGRHG